MSEVASPYNVPSWCIIIPYRDRKEHLERFIDHYKSGQQNVLMGYMETWNVDVPIYVIEQNDNRPFNRAKLLNVGFKEFGVNFDYSAYHDVDMYVFPEYIGCYKFPEFPTHIATRCEQFNWKMPYEDYSGGVILINRDHMIKSNGFSNNLWSWGCEDDEMRNNLAAVGLYVKRLNCYFWCADHPRQIGGPHYGRNLSILKRGRDAESDGLTNCYYRVIKKEEHKHYTHLYVNL